MKAPTSGVVLMVTGSVLFTGMATCVGLAYARDPTLSTFVASALRGGVNLLAVTLLGARDLRGLVGDGRPALWMRGVFGGISLMLYFTALGHLGVGEAAFLNQTASPWVAVLAPIVVGEATPRLIWIAVAGSMVGTAFLAHPRPETGDLVGRVAGLLSGLTSAAAYLSIRKASATNGPLSVVFYFTLVATALSLTFALVGDVPWPVDPVVYLWLGASGLFATVAQLLMTEAYRTGRAAGVAAAGASGPLMNALAGWAILDQTPDTSARIGMVILLASGIALPLLAERSRASGATVGS